MAPYFFMEKKQMKAKNLKPKLFIIPTKLGKFNLLPAAGFVDLPDGYDVAYVKRLEETGCISLDDDIDKQKQEDTEDEKENLRSEYEELAGKKPDGRWTKERLIEEIEKLQE